MAACWGEQTDENRTALHEAYLAIPEHLRAYALGNMDSKDGPLQNLAFDHGEAARQSALAYFAERSQAREAFEQRVPADGPDHSPLPTVTLTGAAHLTGWPPDPDLDVLQNNYPAPITIGGTTYPTVVHAYWGLSTCDEQQRVRIAGTENPHEARRLAERSPRRDGWPDTRLAVMAALLRAKFHQHPHLAEVLLSTGDAPLVSNEYTFSRFWGTSGAGGRHWVARLLEVIRAELAAERAGLGELLADL